jgi:hypothetical protein
MYRKLYDIQIDKSIIVFLLSEKYFKNDACL